MREYLNVGQMSALFHLNKQTLQYYDREKIFSPAYRNPENNYRMYRFDQVYGLALICYLRKLGFSIAQVKKYLDLHNRSSAIQELKKQSALLQQQCQKMLALDEVLQRKLQYVEQQLEQMALGQASIQTLPERKYIPLGEEATLYQNEIFYFYPTIAFVQDAPSGQPRISFGAYLEPSQSVPVRYLEQVETLPAMQMLCAHFQGTYLDAIDLGCQLRLAHPELPLSDDALHFNIVDQFIETAQENYITEIQIPILSA